MGGIRHTLETAKAYVAWRVQDEYEILARVYTYANVKMAFRHNVCGRTYEVSFSDFLKGSRCYACTQTANGRKVSDTRRGNIEWARSMVQRLGEGKYLILDEEYANVHTNMHFKHIDCGAVYKATLNNFRQGTRCPFCSRV